MKQNVIADFCLSKLLLRFANYLLLNSLLNIIELTFGIHRKSGGLVVLMSCYRSGQP